jgi:DNA-binding beta-propeller fold protein YncE
MLCSLGGREGAVCVTDTGNSRLQIFSRVEQVAGAAPARVFGEYGEGPGQFHVPWGVACDGTSLYVSDHSSHRVQKLRLADGAYLGSVGRWGDGDGQFSFAKHLCVAAGAVYVCDSMNNRVVVLGTDLSWRHTIGREGSGDGELRDPISVAVHGGELYVVDSGNHRVQARRQRPAITSYT